MENEMCIKVLPPSNDVLKPRVCIEYSFLSLREGYCEKEIALTNRGLYIITRKYDSRRGEVVENSCEVVLPRIERVRRVKLKGVQLRDEELIKVTIEGHNIIGTLGEVVKRLKYFGLGMAKKRYVASWIYENAEIEEEMFYSPGPWIVDNKVEIAEVPGYLPPWKDNVTFKLLDGGDPGRGIKLLADIVNAFKNPSKAMTILSYGIIAWAKHYFAQKIHYFPYLVIYGPNETGKSLLIDLLKVLYNFPKKEDIPTSGFQLHRLLTKTTVPAMLTEGDMLVRRLKSDYEMQALIAITTSGNTVYKIYRGKYKGSYVSIRSLIFPTHLDLYGISRTVRDMLIVVDLTKSDGFVNNPSVKTPKKMDDQDRADVNAVLREALKLFEARLGQIENDLNNLTIAMASQYYIKLGYDILKEIANTYLPTSNGSYFPPPLNLQDVLQS